MNIAYIFISFIILLSACTSFPKTGDPEGDQKLSDPGISQPTKEIILRKHNLTKRYGNEYESWPEDIKTLILNHRIQNGMTKTQVIVSWGNPLRVFSNSYGDTWQYGGLFYGTRRGYLYFDNKDILTHWSMM